MKCSRPSVNKQVKKLQGTPYFKVKGYFEEDNLDIGERNNCKKVNIPCLTVFGINNCRQMQKNLDDEKIISYVDAKILAQVSRIKELGTITPIAILSCAPFANTMRIANFSVLPRKFA